MKSYFIKQLFGVMFFFVFLFAFAGRLDYWQGWIYVSLGLIMQAISMTILRIDAALFEERGKPGEGAKKWDKMLLGFSFLSGIAMYIVAGLDSGRHHWSPDFHWSLYLGGIFLTASGQLIFLIAQKQNKFFSSTVRIQTDRGHKVCDTGLYSVVRHPAYLGTILQFIGFPLILGSLWSIIPVSVSIIFFVIRTKLEDTVLKNELEGYSEYSEKTRHKLVPLVW